MFSGIIEAKSKVLEAQALDPENPQSLVKIQIEKPVEFNDLKSGDSIAVNGICLTLEDFSPRAMQFALGHETLKVLGLERKNILRKELNLERSLRFGDRVHGHFVTGHVDSVAKVLRSEPLGGSWMLDIEIPQSLSAYVWKKGSLAVNGVSLTINEIQNQVASFCLIPETVSRTNLSQTQTGDFVTIEVDGMARALVRRQSLELEGHHELN